MITHEEALTPLKEIAEKLTRKQWLELTEKIETIRAYITQQEKVTELLGLYQEKDELVYSLQSYADRIDGGYPVDMKDWHRKENRLDEVYKLIEQLEKELGEMK